MRYPAWVPLAHNDGCRTDDPLTDECPDVPGCAACERRRARTAVVWPSVGSSTWPMVGRIQCPPTKVFVEVVHWLLAQAKFRAALMACMRSLSGDSGMAPGDQQNHERDHQVGERPRRAEDGPQDAGDEAGDEVAEALRRREQSERRAADVSLGVVAIAVCSAVSTQPMPTPAMRNHGSRTCRLVVSLVKPRYAIPNAATPTIRTRVALVRSLCGPAARLVTVTAAL